MNRCRRLRNYSPKPWLILDTDRNNHQVLSGVTRYLLTLNPNLAIRKNFFLPNRHGAFEFADGPLAGFEGRTPMRRANTDHDTGLPDLQTTGAMHDADVGDVEVLVRLRGQLFHFAQG